MCKARTTGSFRWRCASPRYAGCGAISSAFESLTGVVIGEHSQAFIFSVRALAVGVALVAARWREPNRISEQHWSYAEKRFRYTAPYYFDTPYYLEPGKRGEKGYALLRDVLKETGYVGVAQVVIRSRQHIAAVIPVDRVLVLNFLRYSYEIRDTKELQLPEMGDASGVSDKEMDMAKRLVEGMAEKWKPKQYKDTYRDDLMARINEKIKSGETHVVTEPGAAPEAPRSAEIIDLAALLRRSLEKKGKALETQEEADEDAEPLEQRLAASSKSVSIKRAQTRKAKGKERKRA